MHNVIIFGGTGMLSAATTWVMQRAGHTTVIGRSQYRLDRLQAEEGVERTSLVPLDYRDSAALRALLRNTVGEHGPIDLALCWIHSTASEAIPIIGEEVSLTSDDWRLFHVKGSAHDDAAIRARPAVPESCRYREVLLGYQRTRTGSRWLVDREVSAGTIQAIEQDAHTTIGQLEPWSARPH
ncbi:Rossmann-fold NAD(P)-binding domain-containing protein [Nesterenkonia ebinurensis]|uniref:hypothetical protein n=1 Tax=Nesterenkonia ebinurensis TaxID=2608252 RepID=UPI00168B9232|nr:hypothetical protein [Nesterenkonia ebinurensis]